MATQTSTLQPLKHVKLTDIKLPTKWSETKKAPFNENILNDNKRKEKVLTHSKQIYLNRNETEKQKNNSKKQLCIDMLKEGYHKSFRELDLIFRLQIDDRYRLGSEHPVWDRPLLDQEYEKLEYLCKKLNKAEEAERAGNFKILYKQYNEVANYFLVKDDSWLSDYFLQKCLNIAENKLASSEPERLAEAHANLGLAYERMTTDYTAKSDRIRECYFKSMQHFETYYKLSQGQDWSVKYSYEDLDKSDQQILNEIKTRNIEKHLKESDLSNMFIDACIHLQRLYRIIAYRYAKDLSEKIQYLKQAYDVCKVSKIDSLEGMSSSLLGAAYEEAADNETALTYLGYYYDISKRDNDLINVGKAAEAISICYEKLGQIDKSIEYLEKYLKDVANKDHVNEQYSRACDCLAIIYNSLGKYEIASEYAKKSFEVSRQLNNTNSVEFNRVLFGISNAHNNLKFFNKNIEIANRTTINNLINWKYDARPQEVLQNIKLNESEE